MGNYDVKGKDLHSIAEHLRQEKNKQIKKAIKNADKKIENNKEDLITPEEMQKIYESGQKAARKAGLYARENKKGKTPKPSEYYAYVVAVMKANLGW